MFNNKLIILITVMLLSLSLKAQYSITIDIKDNTDSILYLGCHFNKGTYAIDTAYNKNGKFVFEKKNKALEPGLYFFSDAKGKYVEFIVDNEHKFSIMTNDKDWMNNLKVKNSKNNEIYFKYIKDNSSITNEVVALHKKKAEIGEQEYNKEISKLRDASDKLKEEFMKKYPEHFLTKMLNATRGIDIPEPEPIFKEDGSLDSLAMNIAQYNYYIYHYFDNIDFKAEGLIRSPEAVFHRMYNKYWDDVLKYQPNDTIIKMADYWIDKARASKTMFKFFVHDITERFLKSNVMGQDEIYINMIKKYYESGQAFWMPPSAIEEEVLRANKWSHFMLGTKIPDLACPDTNSVWHNVYGLRANYKILIFWNPDCGHCRTEIPKFLEFYNKYKDVYNVAVMAINTENFIDDWKKVIREKNLNWINVNGLTANYDWRDYFDITSTPVVFILDKDNRIVGKKVAGDKIEEYIKYLQQGKIKY